MSRDREDKLRRVIDVCCRFAIVTLFAVMCLALVESNASAATSPSGCGGTPSGAASDTNTLQSTVNSMLSPFVNADSVITSTAMSLSSSMTTIAYAIGGILSVTYLLWTTLKLVAGSSDNHLSVMVDVLVPAAMAVSLVSFYSNLISGMQSVAQFGLNPNGGSLSTTLVSYAKEIFSGIATADAVQQQAYACWSITNAKLGEVLTAVAMEGLMYVVILISVVAFAELIGVMLLGSVLVGLSIVVGPVFIVGLVTPWSRSYTTTWVSFLAGAFAIKAIIVIVIQLINAVLNTALTQMTSTMNGAGSFPVAAILALLGILWVILRVFKHIPKIADGLMGSRLGRAPSLVDDAKEKAMELARKAVAV